MAITKEQVFEWAEVLESEGREPTYQSIRERLGNTGSYTTIIKYLRDWKGLRREPVAREIGEIPEVFTQAITKFGMEAWRASRSWMAAEIEGAKNAFELRAKEGEAELEKAAVTIDALQDELEKALKEKDELLVKVGDLNSAYASAHGTLTEAQKRIEAGEARGATLEEQNCGLSEKLQKAAQRITLLEGEVKDFSRKFEITETAVSGLSKEKDILFFSLRDKEHELAKAEGALSEAQKRADVAEGRMQSLDKKNQELTQKLTDEAARRGGLAEKVKELEEALKELKAGKER